MNKAHRLLWVLHLHKKIKDLKEVIERTKDESNKKIFKEKLRKLEKELKVLKIEV